MLIDPVKRQAQLCPQRLYYWVIFLHGLYLALFFDLGLSCGFLSLCSLVSSDTVGTLWRESLHDFFFLDLHVFLSLTGVLDGVVLVSPPSEEEMAPRILST